MNNSKLPVIKNIKKYAKSGELNHKVELGDPCFTPEESAEIITKFYQIRKNKPFFALKRLLAYSIAKRASRGFTRDLELIGLEKLAKIEQNRPSCSQSHPCSAKTGAIITSNHFNPMDTMLPLKMAQKCGKKLFIVSQDTNLALPRPLNFIINHTDLIPLPASVNAIAKTFKPHLEKTLKTGNFVLIYPEEEMWFNYRKPRPCKPGAYRFAAEFGVPIISCFTEMIDTGEPDNEEFNRVRFRFHILDILKPNPKLSPRENAKNLAAKDYALKTKAYEQIYKEPLSYDFAKGDIAGWRG